MHDFQQRWQNTPEGEEGMVLPIAIALVLGTTQPESKPAEILEQ